MEWNKLISEVECVLLFVEVALGMCSVTCNIILQHYPCNGPVLKLCFNDELATRCFKVQNDLTSSSITHQTTTIIIKSYFKQSYFNDTLILVTFCNHGFSVCSF